MEQHKAIEMLSGADFPVSEKQAWVDFGCGTGTFTLALAQLLAPNSTIAAVDKDRNSLSKIPEHVNGITIEKKVGDFVDENDFSLPELDGILMANSLHYVKHQAGFIDKASQFLKPDGCFLIVEYDTNLSSPWVPYPVDFTALKTLFEDAGFSFIQKLSDKPSRYNPSNLYSALIRHKSSFKSYSG